MKAFNINLSGKELDIKLSFRSLMTYERLSGKNYTQIQSLEDTLIYMYSCIISTNKDIKLTFDEFVDNIDECPEVLEEFLSALVDKQEGTQEKKQ